MRPGIRTIKNKKSYIISNKDIELAITQIGGHMAPVTFYHSSCSPIQPYYIAPWAEEVLPRDIAPVLVPLRGDFFCMPFGDNAIPFRGEHHPYHGEAATSKWNVCKYERMRNGNVRLILEMETKIRKARIEKEIILVTGENAIYTQHRINRMEGPMNYGHHATLQIPLKPKSGCLTLSRYIAGYTYPTLFESPEKGGYSCLKIDASFKDLRKVPLAAGGFTNVTLYPDRKGYEDAALTVTDPKLSIGWTTVTFPNEGYLWFSFKDPKTLPYTLFWLSNGGRYYAPWNGRNLACLGIEDICAFFGYGLLASRKPNFLNKLGYPTCRNFSKDNIFIVNYIQGVVRIPKGFDCVSKVRFLKDNTVEFVSLSKKKITIEICYDFVKTGQRAIVL